MGENFRSQSFAKADSDPGGKEDAGDGAEDAARSNRYHEPAGNPDVSGIVFDDPIVHNICHQVGQIEIGQGLTKSKRQRYREHTTVWLEKSQKLDHADISPLTSSRQSMSTFWRPGRRRFPGNHNLYTTVRLFPNDAAPPRAPPLPLFLAERGKAALPQC